jgi:hypothetical protein
VSCLQFLSLWRGELDTTLCDRGCQRLAAGGGFLLFSSTNKTDCQHITKNFTASIGDLMVANKVCCPFLCNAEHKNVFLHIPGSENHNN